MESSRSAAPRPIAGVLTRSLCLLILLLMAAAAVYGAVVAAQNFRQISV